MVSKYDNGGSQEEFWWDREVDARLLEGYAEDVRKCNAGFSKTAGVSNSIVLFGGCFARTRIVRLKATPERERAYLSQRTEVDKKIYNGSLWIPYSDTIHRSVRI